MSEYDLSGYKTEDGESEQSRLDKNMEYDRSEGPYNCLSIINLPKGLQPFRIIRVGGVNITAIIEYSSCKDLNKEAL